MQIEVPAGMSPNYAVTLLQDRLERYAKGIKDVACVNAVITVVNASYVMKTKEVHPGDITFSEEHCKNQRRNGSKFCQACSDQYHQRDTTCYLLDETKPPTCPTNCRTHATPAVSEA